MTILVCPLSRVAEVLRTRAPGRVVSLLDPGMAFPDVAPVPADLHLRLAFHDVRDDEDEDDVEGRMTPSVEHVALLLAFVEAWDPRAPILFHCHAGIGRSAAAGFIAACLRNPETDERRIAEALRRVSPIAMPNETVVALADRALGRHGRMLAAITSTCGQFPDDDYDENEPFELPSAGWPDAT